MAREQERLQVKAAEASSAKQVEEYVEEVLEAPDDKNIEGSVEAMESGELEVNKEVVKQEEEACEEVKGSVGGCQESGSIQRPATSPISPSPKQKSRRKKQSGESSEDEEGKDYSGSEEYILTQVEEASCLEGRGAGCSLLPGAAAADLSLQNGGSQSD